MVNNNSASLIRARPAPGRSEVPSFRQKVLNTPANSEAGVANQPENGALGAFTLGDFEDVDNVFCDRDEPPGGVSLEPIRPNEDMANLLLGVLAHRPVPTEKAQNPSMSSNKGLNRLDQHEIQEALLSSIRKVFSTDQAIEQNLTKAFGEEPLYERYINFIGPSPKEKYPHSQHIANASPTGSLDTARAVHSSGYSSSGGGGPSRAPSPRKDGDSKKRGRSPGDEGDRKGKKPMPKARKPPQQPHLGWRCPFCLAFPRISLFDVRFKSCTTLQKLRSDLT